MLLLTSITDLVRLTTSVATTTIEVHASWVDRLSATDTLPDRKNTRITTAATTTIVPSPGSGIQRNVKSLYITNNSAGTPCIVGVEHTDGITAVEVMQFLLLPGENMGYREDGSWVHRDSQGAEYPPAGLGAYGGRSIPFMKSMSAADATGYWYGSSKDGGFPGAWAPGTPGINGRNTDGTSAADVGCLPVVNPAVGANYLQSVTLEQSVAHTHFALDVLWVNSGINVTTVSAVQTIASGTLPPRDVNGTTAGEGCVIGLYFSAASTLAAVNALSQVTYTNSKGVAGRIATQVAGQAGSQAPATPVIGTTLFYNLAAGDTGVQSIQGFNIGATSWLTGTVNLFIARQVAMFGSPVLNTPATKYFGTPGVRLYNNSCILHFILCGTASATFISGEFVVLEK